MEKAFRVVLKFFLLTFIYVFLALTAAIIFRILFDEIGLPVFFLYLVTVVFLGVQIARALRL
ncbi:MAG: hypothetical protein QW532_00215 [Archaeoglobaceae archaeon]